MLLGVTGSIAAFKAAMLASNLVKSDCDVRVILTPGGARFVTPLTFEAITANPVAKDIWDEQPGDSRMGHLELARWADLVVIAPAGVSALARLALGLGDDLLSLVILACPAPLIIAPAMETNMWNHPATQEHIQTLHSRGAVVVGPESGRLASGVEGTGRMAEPETIQAAIDTFRRRGRDLNGIRVLVTAGPTREAIDPIRYIGNRSSGKMGYAIAEEAAARGATVTLVAGPTALTDPVGVATVHVESTDQMLAEVLRRVSNQQVVVMAAAVADFRPAEILEQKVKRRAGLSLELVPTSDIAREASLAAPEAIHVGFALETNDIIEAAQEKRKRKGLHIIVANVVSADHNPFGNDQNRVSIVSDEGVRDLPLLPKRKVAEVLWDTVSERLKFATSEIASPAGDQG